VTATTEMIDQAEDLRRLSGTRLSRSRTHAPALVAALGGKGGVGSTTVAANLAFAADAAGTPSVFVDADPRGDQPRDPRWPLRLLDGVSARPQLAVFDLGNAPGEKALRFCLGADAVLLVATPDTAALANAFSVYKRLVKMSNGVLPSLHLLINKTSDRRQAEAIRQRFYTASRRMLGAEPRSAGCLQLDEKKADPLGNNMLRLNVRPLSVDIIRRVLVSDALLNWRIRGKFDGHPQPLFATQSEKDF
jgi:hypothetical protein